MLGHALKNLGMKNLESLNLTAPGTTITGVKVEIAGMLYISRPGKISTDITEDFGPSLTIGQVEDSSFQSSKDANGNPTGYLERNAEGAKEREDSRAAATALLKKIDRETPKDKTLHLIADNYATHKKNDDWLARHPNVHFHFTPTSASWLNQVEIWFGIFTRKTLSGASFQTTEQLTQAIEAFVTRYNKTAAPFIWRKREVRGAQLRNTIVNLRN